MHKLLILVINLLLTSITTCNSQPPPKNSFGSKDEKLKAERLPECRACRVFVDSFKKGLERTERGKHEGGDAHWEEQKLGSYKTSELRLIEIQETLCQGIGRGEHQCHQIAEEHESDIEYWWKHQEENPDLFKWLCVDLMTVCCPPNHHGKECTPCTDCSGNGVCKGNGTRKGNGKCNCDKGYQGENCNECAQGFYEAFKDESKLLCSQCHDACQGPCKGPGPRNCEQCKEGWYMKDKDGCFDVNECLEKKSPCDSATQFCVNNEGSYNCLECDRSCDGCEGDGPDMCVRCKEGFELRNGICTATLEEFTETQNSSEGDYQDIDYKDEL